MDTNARNEQEKISLKAVIIADTFTKLLEPLDHNISEVLMPVGNIPILEYMIDFLISNSIKEIIICAKKNNVSIEKYLKKNHKKSKNFIKLVSSDEFCDMGDCLRKISAEKLIGTTEDFVLIRGLVITNFNLEKAINFHKKKKEQDHNRILTSILKNYKNDKDVRTKYDDNVIIYDKNTNKILQYESTYESIKIVANDNLQLKVTLNPNAKIPSEQVSFNYYKVRSDLYDTFIDICNGDILSRFDENFDHQSIRDDFIKNSIVSELYTDTFYLYELSPEDYVGVIKNVETYFKVSNEIINRWAHPVVLEHVTTSPLLEINYKAMNMNIYLDSDVRVDSKAKLINSIALSRGCLIEEEVEISSSTVGKNTQISANTKIKNSIIYANCIIGENANIKNSIIGNGCTIDDGVIITDCIVGDNVHLVENYSELRIYNSTEEENEDDEDEESEEKKKTKTILEKIDKETFLINLEDKDLLFIKKEDVDEDMEEDEMDDESSIEDEEEENYEELIETCIKSGIEKKTDIENILKEVFSLKDAIFEKTKAETIKVCLSSVFQDFKEKILKNGSFIRSHIPLLETTLINWKRIFPRFVPDETEQLNFLAVLEDVCMQIPAFIEVFHVMVQFFNSDEFNVLSDEVIKEWAVNETSSYPKSDDNIDIPFEYHKLFVEKMKKYLD